MFAALWRRTLAGAHILGLAALSLPAVHASGFASAPPGARALGFAGASVAQASDPSAVFYNAAGVAFLTGTQIYLSGGLSRVSTDFVGEGPFPPVATVEQTERTLKALPSIYASRRVSERLTVGVGFVSPFATRSQWANPDQFTGRLTCTDCEISSWSFNPTVAYRIADRLAVGGGLDLRFSNLRLDRRLLAVPGVDIQTVDVAATTLATSTDTALGFNLGLQASPSENVTVGLAYRHRVQAIYAAAATFTQIPTGNAPVDTAVAAALPGAQAATVTHFFPGTLAAGVAVRRGRVLVEADLEMAFWSTLRSIEVRYATSPSLSLSLPQAFETALGARLGVEYELGPTWTVRGGYSYDQAPQPPETYSPFLHALARHGFSVGGTWRRGNVQVDVGGRYLARRSGSTLGASRYDYDGAYQTSALQASVGLGYRF
jgi:long-chain fatty acid transport protein